MVCTYHACIACFMLVEHTLADSEMNKLLGKAFMPLARSMKPASLKLGLQPFGKAAEKGDGDAWQRWQLENTESNSNTLQDVLAGFPWAEAQVPQAREDGLRAEVEKVAELEKRKNTLVDVMAEFRSAGTEVPHARDDILQASGNKARLGKELVELHRNEKFVRIQLGFASLLLFASVILFTSRIRNDCMTAMSMSLVDGAEVHMASAGSAALRGRSGVPVMSVVESEGERGIADKLTDIDARNQVIRQGLLSKCVAPGAGRPLFKFGVIADIQHADIDDATNFSGRELRQYRGVLDTAREAVKYWKDKDLLFVASLGDLVDGQNAGKYGQGKGFVEPQSWTAVERVLDELCKLDRNIPYVHAVGNHEIYNFSIEDLIKIVGISGPIADSGVQSPSPLYYSFNPCQGWRVVMLNGYELSVSLPEGSEGRTKAEQILRANHPHADAVMQGAVDYFEGLSGMNQRFVPFNGAFGEEQLHWLRKTLTKACKDSERVIILSHLPLHPMAASSRRTASARTLAYDAPEALNIIWEHGASCVAAVFAGHSHGGGYFSEPSHADHSNLLTPLPGEPGTVPPVRAGLHHVTIEAALTHKHAYGHIEVYTDRLELFGVAPVEMNATDAKVAGFIPSRTLPLEPK